MKPLLIPAAEYLRMSTDEQKFSITNQKAAIRKYAAQHGFEIVRSYVDPGKSGLVFKYRKGLNELIQDVKSGSAPYQAILVYDVSRWGRFIDADESAYYEFICKQSNVPIHFCAESFENNATITSTILKALKRVMAAEYSRELSVKVSDGLKRLSALGFRTTGTAGYGLRRMLVSAEGQRKQKLRDRERKSIASDRVILVPGPQNEVKHVREIFRMYAYEGMGVTEIVRSLTSRGIRFPIRGQKWNGSNVKGILRNPKYIGMNVWGRTSKLLKAERTYEVPRASWIVKDEAFEPIVDRSTFDKVQRIFGKRRSKHYRYSAEQLLSKLRRLARHKGSITQQLIDQTPGATTTTYISRFGSLLKSYQMAGYKPSPHTIHVAQGLRRVGKLRREVLKRIKSAFPKNIELVKLPGSTRCTLLIDKSIRVAVSVCRSERTPLGHRRWALRLMQREIGLSSLVCLCNERMNSIERFYLLPRLDKAETYKTEYRIKENDALLSPERRLRRFDELYPLLKASTSRQP
jgi:DNA invertase Pin-like site-specific DNA recombinase